MVAQIDIAVPVYNQARFLPRAVASVLSGGVDDIRILIIDNCSTDGSGDVAADLCRRDPRIELVRHDRNLGPVASFNEAVERADAPYFMLLAADDQVTPSALHSAMAVMAANPAVSLAYGRFVSFREGQGAPALAPRTATPTWRLESGQAFMQRSCYGLVEMVSPLVRSAFQKQVRYKSNVVQVADLLVFLELSQFGPVAMTDAVQSLQCLHDGNLSLETWNDPLKRFHDQLAAYDAFFAGRGAGVDNAAYWHSRARHCTGDRAYWSACANMLRGRRQMARQLFSFARTASPSTAYAPPVGQLLRYPAPAHRFAEAAASCVSAHWPRAGRTSSRHPARLMRDG